MNQQRSRRFRAAQEAADKEEEKNESIRLYEAMGHKVSDETRNHKAWDSNAITPGKLFLSTLLRCADRQERRSWTFCRNRCSTGSLTNFPLTPDGRTSKLSFPTPRYPERENTKLSIGSEDNGLILIGTPTPPT